MTPLAATAARGAASTLIFQIIRAIIGFGGAIVLARILAPEDYGLFAMVIALVGLAELLRDFGFFNAAIQAQNLSDVQRNNLFWINSGLGLAVALVVAACSALIAQFYDRPELQPVTVAISSVFLLNGISTQFKAHLSRELQIRRLNIAETTAQAIGAATGIIGALAGMSYWALTVQQIANSGATLLLVAVLARWRPGRPGRAPMRHLVTFSIALTARQVLEYLARNLDSVLIGRLYGAQKLGFYDRAYFLLMVPIGQINTPMTRVAVPTLARVLEDKERYARYLNGAQRVAAYVTVPVFALLVGTGSEVVPVLYGDGWGETGVVLQLLCIGGIFRSLAQVTYWGYLSSGNATAMLRFDVIALPLLTGVILLGLPFGIEGVAATHSLGYLFYWLANLLWMTRVVGLPRGPLLATAWQSTLGLAVPVAAASWAGTHLATSPLLALLAGAACGIAAGAAMVAIARPLRREYLSLGRLARSAMRRTGPFGEGKTG